MKYPKFDFLEDATGLIVKAETRRPYQYIKSESSA